MAEKKAVKAVDIFREKFTCDKCIYEPEKDTGKYTPISKDGKLKIRLELTAMSIFHCPKCGEQFLDKDFSLNDANRDAKKAEKRKKRVSMLRSIYH